MAKEAIGASGAEVVAPAVARPADQQQHRRAERRDGDQQPGVATETGRGDGRARLRAESSCRPQNFSRFASSTEAERRVRKMVTMIASPTTTSAAATTITKKAAICPSSSPCIREKVDQREVRGVQHQLDAHEGDDRVAPDHEPDRADGEQDRREDDVVVRAHPFLPVFVVGRPGASARTRVVDRLRPGRRLSRMAPRARRVAETERADTVPSGSRAGVSTALCRAKTPGVGSGPGCSPVSA